MEEAEKVKRRWRSTTDNRLDDRLDDRLCEMNLSAWDVFGSPRSSTDGEVSVFRR
jgi:hypothetical protein